MGYLLTASLFFSVVFHSAAGSDQWTDAMLSSEIDALQSGIRELPDVGAETLRLAEQISKTIRQELSGTPNEAALRTASFRYLALTNYYTLEQLRALGKEASPLPELDAAKTQSESLLREVSSPEALGETERTALMNTLREVEEKAETAKAKILSFKRKLSIRATLVRLQILFELEPRSELTDAIRLLSDAVTQFDRRNDAETEAKTLEALGHAFGRKAEEWDGRHLWNYLQLRILAKSLAQNEQVSDPTRASLNGALGLLSNARSAEEYAEGSDSLQRITQQAIRENGFIEKDPTLVLFNSPEEAVKNVRLRLEGMRRWMPETRDGYLKTETFLQGAEFSYRTKVLRTLAEMEKDLTAASNHLRDTRDFKVIEAFFNAAHFFQTITVTVAQSALDHSTSFDTYHSVWKRGLSRMMAGLPFMNPADTRQINAALRMERGEGTTRAWVNRQNASVAALSVLLAAEAIAIPFTGGGSAAAMPATLSGITTVGVIGAKTLLITNSVINIADRTKLHGVKGLANLDTVFDAFMILSLTPRPMVGAAPAPTFIGRLSQGSLKFVSHLQYSTAAFFGVAAPTYGTYLLWNADSISESLSKEGILVTPTEVRRKGLIQIALGFVALGQNASYYRQGLAKNGESFSKGMESATFTQGSLPRFINQFRQIKQLRDTYASNPTWIGGVKTVALGAKLIAMDYLLVTEGLLLSYANLDSNFVNHAEKVNPLPDLLEGESAVVLIGFEPSDYFLYAGAQSRNSNRHEIAKYGKRLFVYDYHSPEDLLSALETHAKKHGPVRYLKIATHGRPGKLFTPAVAASPEGAMKEGWIDITWLEAHEVEIRRRSRLIFAKSAQLRLWSCLVGANLDTDDGEGVRVGENFVRKLGDTLLVQGGSIDASTRVLMGLDATVGTLGDESIKASFAAHHRAAPRFALPIDSLVSNEDLEVADWSSNNLSSPWREKLADTLEIGENMARRVVGIFAHWPPVWWTYGVNLEGPFWQSRYLSLDFPDQTVPAGAP
jgi:hypothetical protein